MSEAALSTSVQREFAGRRRRFELRIGEIGELERHCDAGIGAILVRLATMNFKASDIRETVRLGLMGGGETEAEATHLTLYYVDKRPLGDSLQLASDIVNACVNGVVDEGKEPGETERSANPATSPPSTEPVAP